MKILISNDDGIHAQGLHILARYLEEAGHEIYIVAPLDENSGVSHGITLNRPLRVGKSCIGDICFGHFVDGKPSDCVKLAVWGIHKDVKFDMMLSGINKGENLGGDLFYSGTFSAAAEGALLGIKSIAISLAKITKEPNFDAAAKFTLEYMEKIKDIEFPHDSLLNINIPDIPYEDIQGYKYSIQGDRRYVDEFVERDDPRGNNYYWLSGEIEEKSDDIRADFAIIKENYVSITPVNLNLTDYKFFDVLKEKI